MSADSPVSVRALIVEDDADLAQMLATYFKSAAVDVMVAEDGETAFQLAQQHKPDVVVADLMIPRISGAEFIARMRGDVALQKTPIIAISASMNGQDQAAEMVPLLGVDAAFSKPLVLKKLLQAVLALAAGVALPAEDQGAR